MFGEVISAFASELISILTDRLSEYISDNLVIKQTTVQVTKFVLENERNYSGTILDSDIFYRYIRYYNVLDKFITYYTSNAIIRCSTDQFVKNETDACIKHIGSNCKKLTVNERLLIKEIFIGIFNIYENNLCKQLSTHEKILRASIVSEITRHLDLTDKNIDRKFTFLSQQLSDITSIVKNESTNIAIPYRGLIEQNGVSYNVSFTSNDISSYFSMEVYVKSNAEIDRFKNIHDYLNYMFWTGDDMSFDVTQYAILKDGQQLAKSEITPQFNGATYKLPLLFTNNFITNDLSNTCSTFTNIVLRIVPPQNLMEFSIENEKHEILVNNCKFKITRKQLQDIIEITLNDITPSANAKIKLSIQLKGNSFISSSFSILPLDKSSALSLLMWKQLEYKFKSSACLIFRNKITQMVDMEAKTNIKVATLSQCNKEMILYNKLVQIQDYFKTTFSVPAKIEVISQIYINDIYSLITVGIAESPSTYSIRVKNKDIVLNNDIHEGYKLLLSFTFKDITLFDIKLPFEKITAIFPNTICKKLTARQHVFEANTPCIYVYNKKYGKFDVSKLARQKMLEIKSVP